MKIKLKSKTLNIMITAFFFSLVCCIAYIGIYASEQNGTTIKTLSEETEQTPGPISVETVNYKEDTITIHMNGNKKIYYSDKQQKNWYPVEGDKDDNDTITMDMSWIAAKADYELNLKGSEDETIETLEIPAYNAKLKVKFDPIDGKLEFDNDDASSVFQWRKSTSYSWKTVNMEQNELKAEDKIFLDEIEQMRIKGGKIIVRIPAQNSVTTTSFDVGVRQSKEVTVTISKRADAPKVKINGKKFTISTNTTMEYRVDSIGTVLQGDGNWKDAEANMSVMSVAPQALYKEGGVDPQEVILEIRKQATGRAGYSKSMYLTIPVQEKPPTEGSLSTTDNKILVTFSLASKTTPYEYLTVKAGDAFTPEKSSWKKVDTKKTVIFQEKTLPTGSAIYIRKSGVEETSTKTFVFPSAYKKIEIGTTN